MNHLQQLLEAGRDQSLFPGATCRIFDRSATLFESSVGLAQPERELAAGPDTVWDLASLTKPMATATSLLILAQEGRLHLDEEVTSFLAGDSPSLAGITLRHCLTHTSGLKAWVQLHGNGWSPDEIMAKVRAAEPSRPPGAGYTYSDLGYILLGEVVRQVAGQPVAAFASSRVFEPLRMDSARFQPPEEWSDRLAATRCPDRGRVLLGEVHDGNCAALGGIAGHAGLFGSLNDVTRYGRMLLNEGELEGQRILSPQVVREMARNQNPPGMNGHTLGWFTRPSGFLPAADFLPPDTFGHTGFTGTSLVLSPSFGIGIALLTNRVYCKRDAGDFLRWRRRFHNAAAGCLT